MTNNISPNSPIGVFDSGLGGLTVLKSLEKLFPYESFIYFGDTAHVPYGSKSIQTVRIYSEQILKFLMDHQVKAVVVACNTASALIFHYLKDKFNIPLFDVVSPSVEYSLKITRTGNVGIIGTIATINSKAYTKMFSTAGSKIEVIEVPCPLFVPIIEEGWSDTSVAKDVAKVYLKDLKKLDIDTLILGCTHYPIMVNTIQSVLSDSIQLVFSGEAVGLKMAEFLKNNSCQNMGKSKPKNKFFVTDFPQKFDELGSRFLGRKLENVQHISLM